MSVFDHSTQHTEGVGERRRRRGAARLAAIAAVIAGVPLAAASPAAALPGLEVRQGFSDFTEQPTKFAQALCPANKHVVGGGGGIVGRSDVRLTGLIPSHIAGQTDRFLVLGQAPSLTENGDWRVDAYAICADRGFLDNHHYRVVQDPDHPLSSTTFQKTAARCPDGTVAYSAGANISSPNGHVGLQLNRTSGPLDISRATAREDTGWGGAWNVRSFAVCADSLGGIHAEGTIAPGPNADHRCSDSYRVHGPGGGGGLTDGGPAWLTDIRPDAVLKEVSVDMTGPLSPGIGGMVAHATCGL